MAVVDKYVNEKIQKDKLAEAVEISGNKHFTLIQKFNVDPENGDAVNSVYRLFKAGANLIPVSIKFLSSGVTGLTGDLGIYEEGLDGKPYAKNVLAADLSLATETGLSKPVDGLASLTIDNYGKKFYELAGHKVGDKDVGYDIALTLKGAPTVAGTVIVIGEFVQG